MDNDTLIFFGDALKALDDTGRVGGMLVRFSKSNRKDLSGQYFDSKGYYGPKDGDESECLFDHGYPVPAEQYVKDLKNNEMAALVAMADHTFAPIKTRRTPLGIFAETVLNLEDEYEAFIHSRVKAGKIGWSSGASGHRVKIEKDGRITRWPISEGSLTPRPCEPMNMTMPLKSLAAVKFMLIDETADSAMDDEAPVKTFALNSLAATLNKHIDDRVDNGHSRDFIIKSLARESGLDHAAISSILSDEAQASNANLKAFARVLAVSADSLKSARRRDYARTIKGMFEEALADNVPSRWQLDSVYCDIMRKVAATAQASSVTGVDFDVAAKIKEATGEYMMRLETLAVAQVNDYVESGSDEPFYLKAIVDAKDGLLVSNGIDFDDHSELVVSAFQELTKRFRANADARKSQKAGRVLSDKNRQRLSTLVQQIKQAVSDCEGLLEETKPMASDEAMRAAQTRHLALRTERRVNQLGV